MTAAFRTTAIALVLTLPGVARAEVDQATVDAIFTAMSLSEMIEIMQTEGIDYGAQIADDLFPGRPTDAWEAAVNEIYALDRMEEAVRTGLGATLAPEAAPDIIAFFSSDLGQEIISLEVAARRALMDDSVEQAAEEAAAQALIDDTPRAQLARAFVETNDLVETNVVGALNASYAFYLGLQQGGGLPSGLSEGDLLADVWAQEPEIRQNTTEWVYSYLMLAYQPLSDDELQAYIDFSETPAGQSINTALFAAFDTMYEDISAALGRGAAVHMAGEDL